MKGWLHSGYIYTIATYGKYLFGVTEFQLYRILKAMIVIQGNKIHQSRSKKGRLLKGSLPEIIQVRYQRNSFREEFCLLKQFVLKRPIFLIVWERVEKKINVKQVEKAQEERNPRVDSWRGKTMKDRRFGEREKASQEQSSESTELRIQEKRREEHTKYLAEVSVNAKQMCELSLNSHGRSAELRANFNSWASRNMDKQNFIK